MNAKEAKRIFDLTDSVKNLLKDVNGLEVLEKFASEELPGGNRLANKCELYRNCVNLLQEEKVSLTDAELKDLISIGIPREIKNELTASVGGERATSNDIIAKIKETCVNEIGTLSDFDDFKEHILLLAN